MHYFLVIFQYTLSPKTKRAIFTTEWFQMINCFMLFQSLLVIEVFTTVTTHIFLKQDKRNQACKGMAPPSKGSYSLTLSFVLSLEFLFSSALS